MSGTGTGASLVHAKSDGFIYSAKDRILKRIFFYYRDPKLLQMINLPHPSTNLHATKTLAATVTDGIAQ